MDENPYKSPQGSCLPEAQKTGGAPVPWFSAVSCWLLCYAFGMTALGFFMCTSLPGSGWQTQLVVVVNAFASMACATLAIRRHSWGRRGA